jgi:hypothetical protein
VKKVSKYSEQLNVKLSPEMRMMLDVVCKFETAKPSELIRLWVREKLHIYFRNPQFKRWLKFHPEDAHIVEGAMKGEAIS